MSVVGIAIGYGLDGPGIKSQLPSDQRRKSVAARLLGLRVRIPPGAWLFVLCVCVFCKVKDKNANSQKNQDKGVLIKYRKRTQKIPGVDEIFCTRPNRPWDSSSVLYSG